MQNEILKPVLATDETAIPRYDIVNPDGSVAQQNVELRLKNEVMQQGTPYDEESVLPATLREKLGLPNSATPANAFEAVVAKAGAKVSMNEPSTNDNIAAGYSIGAMWLRPSFIMTNLCFDTLQDSFTMSGGTASKVFQTFTFTGNGDDKVISATMSLPSTDGWLYAVITPDETASSARLVIGSTVVQLTIGKANDICIAYTGTSLLIEVTYSTANIASSGSLVVDNLTILDKATTLESGVDAGSDLSVATLLNECAISCPFDTHTASTKLWQHDHDSTWKLLYDSSNASLSTIEYPDVYMWRKASKVPATEDVTEVTNLRVFTINDNGSGQYTFSFGGSIARSAGNYVLQNVESFRVNQNGLSNASNYNRIIGKWLFPAYEANITSGSFAGGVYYIPEDATITSGYISDTFPTTYITASRAIKYANYVPEVINFVKYLGGGENTYPSVDATGYVYDRICKLGDFVKMFIGTYVGTGSMFSLKTPFRPKFGTVMMGSTSVTFYDLNNNSSVIIDDSSVSISNTSLDAAGSTGYYFILG